MSSQVSMPTSSVMLSLTSLQEVMLRIKPFISGVALGTARTGRVGDGVQFACRRYPGLAGFFQIDLDSVEETFGLKEEYLHPVSNSPMTRFVFLNRDTRREYTVTIPEG